MNVPNDNSKYPMMKCGCRANAYTYKDEVQIPSCAIHLCTEIDKTLPDLSNRKARCHYYGTIPKGRNHESNYGCKRGEKCLCERLSTDSLPFFQHKPDNPFDEFYCGCWGWD